MILPAFVLLLIAAQPALSLECIQDDVECLARCRPGTIQEPKRSVIETECYRPDRVKIESQVRCYKGKIPNYPVGLLVSNVTNTSASISWTPSDKWPKTAQMHYECHLTMEKHLAAFFEKEELQPRLGSQLIYPSRTRQRSTPTTTIRVDGLRPGQWYNCFLWVEFPDVQGAKALAKVKTERGVPAFPVSRLQLSYSIPNDSIVLKWHTGRPKCDPVTGYKLMIGGTVHILNPSNERHEISLHWWYQLAGAGDGLVNVTIAPMNALGVGPEFKVAVIPPPYENFHLSSSDCDSQDKVHMFENLPVGRSSNRACYQDIFYQECIRNDP